MKFCVICFCFQKNVVYIFPANSGWGKLIFLVNSSQISCVGRLIIFSLLESWYVASKPVCGLTSYKLRRSVLTSSLKPSVLCERLRIRIVISGLLIVNHFDLLTSFIQDSADKHIPSKTSRSVSSIPWITPEIRRKIRRKNKTHAKAKKTGSSKLRSKFETLRREIKADVRKQHDLYVNNLVGDVKANPRDFYRYINSQKKTPKVFHPWKGKMERVLLSRISKRQRNSMVSLRMCSVKMNTPRSRF